MVQGKNICFIEFFVFSLLGWCTTISDNIILLQPVEVWTKLGRRGRIKEPVGTHGTLLIRPRYSCEEN